MARHDYGEDGVPPKPRSPAGPSKPVLALDGDARDVAIARAVPGARATYQPLEDAAAADRARNLPFRLSATWQIKRYLLRTLKITNAHSRHPDARTHSRYQPFMCFKPPAHLAVRLPTSHMTVSQAGPTGSMTPWRKS